MLVAPTGSGKTVVMASISHDLQVPMCAIAHRKELVGQISKALARVGVEHDIIAPESTISFCISEHISELGRSFFRPQSNVSVASVDTINARRDQLVQWASKIGVWMIDEAHHVVPNNKWGRATSMFSNAHGVGYTASPIRCDRKTLAASQGGTFHDICIGPGMRELMDQGYLSKYRIFGPPQSIRRIDLEVSKSTGDFKAAALRQAAEKSTITGDIVEHYLKIAPGKRGITFTVDVKHAERTAAAFREAGVPAECVSAKTPDSVREMLIRKFTKGSILQLVNVDLFGEGFDVPAVEVVSMGRPTQSFGLYLQQFGRALRLSEGKEAGIIIDHVGNVKQHGLPDAVREWRLEVEPGRRRAIKDPDVMPVTTCVKCFRAYEATHPICPHCGVKPEPESRSEPKFVDGDLFEYSPELIAQMRGEIDRIDGAPVIPISMTSDAAVGSVKKRWRERQNAQRDLRSSIAQWAGVRKHVHGEDDPMIYRRFYHRFGTDIMSAMTLGRKEAEELKTRIGETL